tara:strand:- start:125 stop:535 length:411 start_codon:yes stop_codon:yes gene_type:complete
MVLVSACTQQAPEVQPEPTPQPEVQPTPEVVEVVEEEPEEVIEVVEPVATTNEVRIVGTEGFEPEELSIVTGSAVTWINDGDRRAAVIIFKDGRSYVNSPPIDSEGKFEHEFNEVGSYEFWLNIAYGVIDGKIIVE